MTSKSHSRKTKRGAQFQSPHDLIEWLRNGFWIYFNHKPTHPGWAMSWQLGQMFRSLEQGRLYECLEADSDVPYLSPTAATYRQYDLDAETLAEFAAEDVARRDKASNFVRNIRGRYYEH